MTTLYSFGADPTRWYSRSKFSSTTDETSWTTGSEPVPSLGSLTTVARNGIWWCGATNFGQITVSNDLASWYAYDIESKLWLVTKIRSGNSKFVAVGHEKNPNNLQETGFIATSPNGAPATWVRRWVSYASPLCLFDVRHLGGLNWIAVGNSGDLAQPVLLYSIDGGITWESSTLPSIIQGAIYSVESTGVTNYTVWIGGKGWVARCDDWEPNTTQWILNDQILDGTVARPVTRIFYRDTLDKQTLVALTGSTAWFTSDNTVWFAETRPGYRFLDATNFYNPSTQTDTLYLSAGGMMNQYTGFKTSWLPRTTETLTLAGFNSGVQASSLIVV